MHSFAGKEEGQNPNSEDTDSHEIGVEVLVAEVDSELGEEVQMMAAVVQEGMADKKPYPNLKFFFTI